MNQKAPKRRYSEGKEIVEDDCDSLTSENAVHPTLLLSNPPQSSWKSIFRHNRKILHGQHIPRPPESYSLEYNTFYANDITDVVFKIPSLLIKFKKTDLATVRLIVALLCFPIR